MTKVALYARYSDELQSPTSIDDQLRICRERAKREGWQVVGEYTDRAITGSVMGRSGLQQLLADARQNKFDVVIAEALDRLSRDQEGTAHIYKRLKFSRVRIVTLSENEIGVMDVGLRGTMNQLFLTELGRKTHRGLEGRVLAGKSAGGLSYGYAMVRNIDASGTLIRGERVINEDEAKIVQRIFNEYRGGKSPRKIAFELNADGIPGPRGSEWAASTINGNRKRGTGILNNELYVGVLIWDRQTFERDPDTGKRIARMNTDDKTKRVEVPELRIIDQDLWDDVRAYQAKLDRKLTIGDKRRPPKLFSHLLKCGCCGGGMSIVAPNRYGCSTARNKGTCDNRITMSETDIEQRVLSALQTRLMDPALCEVFCEEYTRHLNTTRIAHNAARAQYERDLEKVERGIKKLIQSIKDGVPGVLLKDEAVELDRRKTELTAILSTSEEAPVLIHPKMGQRYNEQIRNLVASLHDTAHREKSALILRKLIDKIVLAPNEDRSALTLDLIGDLAGILLMSNKKAAGMLFNPNGELDPAQLVEIERARELAGSPSDYGKVSLVAGVGFEPTTFRL
jgi:site-specific DNA recombinase